MTNREFRPWGWFDILHESPTRKIKILSVNPGGILSKQSHKQRNEFWYILSGQAEIEINGLNATMLPHHTIRIQIGDVHRVKNISNTQLEILELQTGTYFGEDDIIRYEDVYGRN